jgi:membrane-associated phospholipid phosphatase
MPLNKVRFFEMKPATTLPEINRIHKTFASICLGIFLGMVSIVFIFKNTWIDDRLFSFLSCYITSDRTGFMKFITYEGNTYFLVPANLLLLVYFIMIKNKWWAISVAAISLSSLGLMSLLKNLFHRHRPPEPMVDGITNFSFPSGHAFMSVAFYGLLVWWVASSIKNKWLRRMTIVILLLLILIIGLSRIYLRVHYFTDVMAGLSMGTAWLILSVVIIKSVKEKRFSVRK